MRSLLMCGCLNILFFQAVCQTKDTVRSNVNYRSEIQASEGDEVSNKFYNHYFSLQANQLLRQILNLSSSTTNTGNPFSFNYSFNAKTTGSGLAFGLGYATNHVEDKDQGSNRETDNSNINFRFGYDKKVTLAKRWMAGWGMDALVMHTKNFTQTTQNGFIVSEVQSKSNGWGLGPRVTLLFSINKRIYLGTESSWYFQKLNTKSDISFNGGGKQKSEQKNSSFALQVPVAIFLTLKF